ncbi:hypothetical protein MTP99_006036 [Tenebrio molitor]|jgi:hypothetical protein|uniref:RE1-silencing transcription factor B-like n=1 Tax=Tenebrio molitor TaxID=7067 RepID=UPI001C3B4517|nr:hypothetical protein MTP99_006036 [Tenebrio molitor]CAH1382122.1 unnamed protein product [Tenebrio molitor]
MSIICRACLQNVDKSGYFYIDTFDNTQIPNTIPKDLLQLCVPEMDLYISEQPGICGECLSMFESFYNFKNKCLASEEKIHKYLSRNKMGLQCKVNLTRVVDEESEPPQRVDESGEVIQMDNMREADSIKVATAPNSEFSDEMMIFSCNECSFVTMDQVKLVRHKCLEVTPLDKYKCPYCDYSTCRRYRLSYHINAKHTKTSSYECAQCDYKTNDANLLKRHQKTHGPSEKTGEMFTCPLCEFSSGSAVALQRHRVAQHGPVMQCCTVCSYQTKDKSNFRKHLYIHGDKPRKCTKCSYQCVSPYQLEKHYKRSHV